MDRYSLDTLAREHLEKARGSHASRSSETVFGGHQHAMRQTIVALLDGAQLDEHNNPGEATLYVLVGRVELTAGADSEQAERGEFLVIPDERHGLRALADSVVLLTAVPRGQIR